MSIFGLPLIMFQVEEEDEDDMGDLEYLSRIANGELSSGVLKNFQNINANPNTTIIATVPGGKDWYLMGWSVSMDNANTQISLQFPAGNVVDSTRTGTTNEDNYIGIAKGNKATAGQDISRELESTVNSNRLNLFILEVDTGVSPKLT